MIQHATALELEPAEVQASEKHIHGISVVLPVFKGGGAQRDMILLCNAIAAKCVPINIIVLRNEGPLRALVDPNIPVIEVPGQRIRYAIPGLRRAFRRLNPRYVVGSESNLNLCCLLAVKSLPKSQRPKIVLREVCSPSAAQKHDPHWQNRVAYGFLRRMYRSADRVITLTDGARRDLIENFSVPSRNVSAMYTNAVITEETADRIACWDGEQGREPGLIVSVGRLSPEKNHRLLLQATSLMSRNRPWRLVLVGEGKERPALEEFVRASGLSEKVTFAGYADDPFAWLMRAQVSVCSSIYEGLCNAVIESLGCGTPVVSTDCPFGPREILQHGKYGTLVPPGDPASLATAIEAALDGPVDREFLKSRAFNYTAERAADNFLEVIADTYNQGQTT